ncbi:MAG: co-chaperone GroES [Phycisphaerae bacterium]|nr:co-chaperone GroES [Phycisphaerae bacterium]
MAKKSAKKTSKKSKKTSASKGKSLKIRPLGDRVLVQRVEAEEKTAGGIVLPDTAKEKPQRGTVLALGDGPQLDDGSRGEFQVAVGQTVLFTSFAGTDITLEGEDYLLMRESDIVAIID